MRFCVSGKIPNARLKTDVDSVFIKISVKIVILDEFQKFF